MSRELEEDPLKRSMQVSRYVFAGMAAVGFLMAPAVGGAQPLEPDVQARVDAVFQEWNKSDSPGAAVVIVRDRDVAYTAGYGMADLDQGVAITPRTVFDIASVSKHFTTVAIMHLVEQGSLSLDDDVHEYVPELPDFGSRITIRHLVHHVSGIRDWVELLYMAGWRFDDVISGEDIMSFATRQDRLNFEPGSSYAYSNTGYNLLAEIVARVSGQSYAAFMENNFFRPLEMTQTRVRDDHGSIIPSRARSYQPSPAGEHRLLVNNTSAVGSSSVFTTAEDLGRWILFLQSEGLDGQVVSDRLSEQGVLNDGTVIPYAIGLRVDEVHGLRTVGHGGSWRGYRSNLLLIPERDLGIAVVSNVTSFNSGATARAVLEALLPGLAGEPEGDADQDAADDPSPLEAESTLASDQAAEYLGHYFAPELLTTYELVPVGGTISLRHHRHPDEPLTYIGSDTFVFPGIRGEQQLDFFRDQAGRILGFELAGARFEGVRFERR